MIKRTFRALPWLLALFVPLLLLTPGCVNETTDSATEPLPGDHWFDLSLGDTIVSVQLAVTRGESAAGLMHRQELGENQGMLFFHPRPIQASYWMKNVSFPLDIGFFNAEGRLLEVQALFPHDETPVKSRSHEVLFALEMNRGWFAQNRVRSGVTLDLDELRDALRARGFDPAGYRF